jgi:hypothetical protein
MDRESAELRRLAEEAGEPVAARSVPANEVDVDLRSERITVRLSREEVLALNARCRALVGRSTFMRMMVRESLGLAQRNAL